MRPWRRAPPIRWARCKSTTSRSCRDPWPTGYPRQGPYDVIVLGGAVEHIPPTITDQLKEGGRLVGGACPAGSGRSGGAGDAHRRNRVVACDLRCDQPDSARLHRRAGVRVLSRAMETSHPLQIDALALDKIRKQNQKVTILDVREPWEFAICAIKESINVPLSSLPQKSWPIAARRSLGRSLPPWRSLDAGGSLAAAERFCECHQPRRRDRQLGPASGPVDGDLLNNTRLWGSKKCNEAHSWGPSLLSR